MAVEYQTLGHIDRLDPALDELIAPDAKIEKLCAGFTWCEGPVWREGALYFSDVPENIIYRWQEGDTKAAIYLQPSGMLTPTPGFREQGSNGLALDPKGQLVICEHGERRLALLGGDHKTQTAIIDHFEGKRFNSPNDAAIRRNGDIYFTDPPYGLEQLNDSPLKQISFNGVYRVTPEGQVSLVTKDLTFPNGIAFSPDEKTLYIAVSDSNQPVIMAYDVQPDGGIRNGRIFADGAAAQARGLKGAFDGLKVDALGHIFTSAPGGLQIYSAAGKPLGLIVTDTVISNCAWGDDGATLYFTADHMVCRLRTKTRGDKFPFPSPRG